MTFSDFKCFFRAVIKILAIIQRIFRFIYQQFVAHKSLTTRISSLILVSHSSLAQWPSRLKYEPIIAAFDLLKYSLTFSLVTPDPIKMGDLHLLL